MFNAEIFIMKKTVAFIIFTFLLLSNNSFADLTYAPDINLPGIDGNVQLKNLKGKVVYLDFWASWCLPCKKSFPWMNEMKDRYSSQGFEILAVNLDKDRTLADEFLKEMPANFLVAFDASGDSASTYKLKGMPGSYMIGRNGMLHASHIGFREKDKDKLEQLIKDMLDKK